VTALVLDASAALILLGGEPGREAVRDRLRDRILAGEPVRVPPVFWIQVIEGLVARGHPPELLVEAVYELDQLGLETAEVGRPGVLALVDAVGRGVDAHAAAYLVLAEVSDAELLTAAPDLAVATGERAIFVGPRRRRGRLQADRSWTRWKGAAAYLRQLRSAL
jgi:predicted nucleic acid-binding protein